jgi:hypothetical protein
MNQHVATVVRFRRPIEAMSREEIVKNMANHLYAGRTGGLDLRSEIDVIDYLWRTPEQYHHRVILDHLDDALVECQQMIVAAEMSHG